MRLSRTDNGDREDARTIWMDDIPLTALDAHTRNSGALHPGKEDKRGQDGVGRRVGPKPATRAMRDTRGRQATVLPTEGLLVCVIRPQELQVSPISIGVLGAVPLPEGQQQTLRHEVGQETFKTVRGHRERRQALLHSRS